MQKEESELLKLIRKWDSDKPKKVISEEPKKEQKEDVKFIGVEPDNDNGMTLYDHLYNGF